MTNEYSTLNDVAALTKLSINTVRAHRRTGILEADRLGGAVRVSPDQLERYLARLKTMGGAPTVEEEPTRHRDPVAVETTREIVCDVVREIIASGELDGRIRMILQRMVDDGSLVITGDGTIAYRGGE